MLTCVLAGLRCRSGPREKRGGAAEGVGRAGLPGPSGGESEGGLGWSLGRDGLGFGLLLLFYFLSFANSNHSN